MKLDVKAMGITGSVFWAFAVLGVTWWIIAFGGSTGEQTMLGRIYRGYTISPTGSLIGFLWALPDGFICGALLAWMYNRFATDSPRREAA